MTKNKYTKKEEERTESRYTKKRKRERERNTNEREEENIERRSDTGRGK